jgi:hypothetical protein
MSQHFAKQECGTHTGSAAARDGVSGRPAWVLRALIRNDEALVEHYAEQLEGADGIVETLPFPGDYSDERAALIERLGDTIRRLQLRRASLNAGPAATTVSKPAALVTLSAAGPAPL